MLLLIDNYDSFSYNLVQEFGAMGMEVEVVRNDKLSLSALESWKPSYIVISPGPGRPEESGCVMELIRAWGRLIPMLGICLGHQAIGCALGAEVAKAPYPMHGKTSTIFHYEDPIFRSVPKQFTAARYHSLAIQRETLPDCLKVIAETSEGEIMGVRFHGTSLVGLQFHPESICTPYGTQILTNFIEVSASCLQ